MPDALKSTLKLVLRSLMRPALGPPVPVALQRPWVWLLTRTMLSAPGVRRSQEICGGVPCERLQPAAGETRSAVLFLHGGAYVVGSPATHRSITTQLARLGPATVLVPDYRLAPEHPYPAALDDALAAYEQLLAEFGPGRVAVSGDSAGGNLALALVIALRDRGRPLPAAMALVSPWTDLGASGESIIARAARDPMLRPGWARESAAMYCGNRAADDPLLSPLFAELGGLPPILIQVGSEEILYSDSERLDQRLRAAGVRTRFHCYDGLWHDFHLYARVLPEADAALAEMAAFMAEACAAPAAARA